MIWLLTSLASASVVCPVDSESPGCEFYSIQEAIDGSIAGETISVRKGVYKEQVVIDKDITVEAQNTAFSLFGTDPDTDAVVTINGGTVVLRGFAVTSSTNRGVKINDGDVTLDNLTVAVSFIAERGSGVLMASGDLTVTNSTFLDHISASGGSHLFTASGNVLIEDSVFEGGYAGQSGGGILVGLPLELKGGPSLAVRGSTFFNNRAGVRGGAIQYSANSTLILEGSRFENNQADVGGAIATGDGPIGATSNLTVQDCTFAENEASSRGGAIHSSGALSIGRSLFYDNVAGASGGAVSGQAEHLLIDQFRIVTLIANRFCGNESPAGGAAALGTYVLDSRNNVFLSNDAESGGALYLKDVEGAIRNETLVGGGADQGSAITVLDLAEPLSITNTVLAFNRPGRAVSVVDGEELDSATSLANLSEDHNAFFGHLANYPDDDLDVTDITEDPQFFDYTEGGDCEDQSLWGWAVSPLRDAGAGDIEVDGTPPDIGAYGGFNDGEADELDLDEVLADDDDDGSPKRYDCDPEDPNIHEDADETWYNGVDEDCDRGSDFDQDGDGFDSELYGGDDCNDEVEDFKPGAEETAYDGLDQDCDGQDLLDADGDGFDSWDHGGTDCNDRNPDINPEAEDEGLVVDDDCDGFAHSDDIEVRWPGCASTPLEPTSLMAIVAFLAARRQRRRRGFALTNDGEAPPGCR